MKKINKTKMLHSINSILCNIFTLNCIDNNKALLETSNNYLKNNNYEYLFNNIDNFLNANYISYKSKISERTKINLEKINTIDINYIICKTIYLQSLEKLSIPFEYIFSKLFNDSVAELVTEEFLIKHDYCIIEKNNYIINPGYDFLVKKDNVQLKVEVKNYDRDFLRLYQHKTGVTHFRVHNNGKKDLNWDLCIINTYTTIGLRPIYTIKNNSLYNETEASTFGPAKYAYDKGYIIADAKRIDFIDNDLNYFISHDYIYKYNEKYKQNNVVVNKSYLKLCNLIDYNMHIIYPQLELSNNISQNSN